VYLNLKVNLSPSKIHYESSLFIPYLASIIRESTQKFGLGTERMTLFGYQRSPQFPPSFKKLCVACICVAGVKAWRAACKFPSPWHKSSHRLLFSELLRHQAIVVGSQYSLPFLSASRDVKSF
jgi:hypothetical protein